MGPVWVSIMSVFHFKSNWCNWSLSQKVLKEVRAVFVGGISKLFLLQKNARLCSINNSLEEKVSFPISTFWKSLLACAVFCKKNLLCDINFFERGEMWLIYITRMYGHHMWRESPGKKVHERNKYLTMVSFMQSSCSEKHFQGLLKDTL